MGGRRMSEEKLLEGTEERREKELSSIDRLFQDIRQYCTGAEFIKKLEFYSKFPYIGAYNAALVEEQRPGARFVLTARKWKKEYQRKIKLNSRPVMILLPFYPVEFLFDISDTEPIHTNPYYDDDQVIEDIIKDHMASCVQDIGEYFRNLEINLPKNGISYNHDYIVGSELRAETRVDSSEKLRIQVFKDLRIVHHNHFAISVDFKAKGAEELALLFHELAHLFCRHIAYSWWKVRSCTKEEKEFEAETVSYLVCRRLGINYNPMKYLAGYVDSDLEIPNISLDSIFRAVDQIELLAKGYVEISKSFLYKNDDTFKKIVDEERERIRNERARAKAVQQSF